MTSLINFYEKIPEDLKTKYPVDRNYKNHMIDPTSNILIIGQSGTGKTNALINFLSLKNDCFAEVIIFTGTTADEPLYNFLKKKNPEVQLIDNIDELPELSDFNDADKSLERLIVFDDVAGLPKKDETKLKNFIKACRKYGFTALFIYQSYATAPKFIRDNSNVFWIFKQPSTVSLEYILRDKKSVEVDKRHLFELYEYATGKKGDFFQINTKGKPENMFRRNFTEILR